MKPGPLTYPGLATSGTNHLSGEAPPTSVAAITAFIVVKMEFRDGSDRFTLFMNPTPGKPEPSDGVVKEDLHLELADKLFLYSRGAWSVDEIRLGTIWHDVTPAAEVRAR